MAKGYVKQTGYDGKPSCPDGDLGAFGPAREGRSLNDDGASKDWPNAAAGANDAHEGGAPGATGDLGFVKVSSGQRNSSILSQGPVDIPKEGGPDSQRS